MELDTFFIISLWLALCFQLNEGSSFRSFDYQRYKKWSRNAFLFFRWGDENFNEALLEALMMRWP